MTTNTGSANGKGMPGSFRDLELPAYDVADMAMLMLNLLHDALVEECDREVLPGYVAVPDGTVDMLLFASRLMIEKARAVKAKWTEIHDAGKAVAS